MIGRFFSSYGMAGVLVLLCGYYAWATLAEQQPRGASAAAAVVRQVRRDVPPPADVMVVGRTGDDDRQFVDAAAAGLTAAGYHVAAAVTGSPRDAKVAVRQLAAAHVRVAAVVATPEAAASPALAGLHVVAPRPYRWPTFLLEANLLNVANQIAVVAILAVGMTLVIMTGGIDLSVGSLIALSAVTTALLIRDHGGTAASTPTMVLASAAGIGACAAIGLCTGGLVTVCRMPPFIATLGVMQIASGLAFRLSHSQSVYEVPDRFTWLGRSASLAGVPNGVVLMAGIYLVAHAVMARTTFGRYVYAVGGNPEAARLSGVRVGLVLASVYTLSGAAAGLGGVVLASQLKSGAPTYGQSYELYVIAAVVVGGTSLTGGEGRVLGTLIGALIIAVIQNGMNLTGVESAQQRVVLGFMILAAVLLDLLKRRPVRWPRWARLGTGRSRAA